MKNHRDAKAYKHSYAGVEANSSFPTRRALEDYRRHLLEKSQLEVDFIARRLGPRKLNVMEFCSGNGRLLIALALRGMLNSGIGVEISPSRVAFAKRWVSELGLNHIRLVQADVLEFDDFLPQTFDLGVCIGDALSYFRGVSSSASLRALSKMRRALTPTGCFLLEVDQMSKQREEVLALSGGKLRLWMPLPHGNRFSYALHNLEYFRGTRVLRHEKIFIGRDGMIDKGRIDVLGFYSEEDLLAKLGKSGFGRTYLYGDFSNSAFIEGTSERLIGLAGMPNWRDFKGGARGVARPLGKTPPAWASWMGTMPSV